MLRLSFIVILSISLYAQSPHGTNFKFDCEQCHTTEGWKVIPSAVSFNHDVTKFILTGRHQSVECRQCHESLKFSETSGECFDCHKDIHQNTVGSDCRRCHNTNSWLVTNINALHERERFPLVGRHISARCEYCHMQFNDLRFTNISTGCFDCHQNDYYSAKTPDHIKAAFSTECSECHNISSYSWKAGNINHDFFPLTGKHNIPNCFNCHRGNTFTGLSTQCYSCHSNDYVSAVNPDHQQAAFSTECGSCHNINGWSPASFNHSITEFPLTGAHINVSCSTCHSEGYSNVSTQCYSCHKSNYDNTQNPVHIVANFPTNCESCHNTNAWTPANFDHDGKYFPIYSGIHRGKWNQCSECHTVQNNFILFSCIDCHEHNKTATDDEHKEIQGYVYASSDCFACHPTGTAEGSINHSLTNFPLTGAHLNVNCSECHQNGYAGTPLNCVDCHNLDYQNTTNPSHQTLALSKDCGSCHTTITGWKPATFTIHNTYYELTGAHLSISSCFDCHKNNYTTTSDNCYACHQNDFNNAVNPNHVNAGISNKCEDCHTPAAWNASTFVHTSTGFELTGAHKPVQCSSCHKGTTAGLSGACIECHQLKYDSAPDHKTQNYPQDCEMCHNTTIWTQTEFNHANTSFPLTGAHINTNCSACHQDDYTGTTVNCADCHNEDYLKTVNPSHQLLALSTECSTCHTTSPGWKPASFSIHNNLYELVGAHAVISNDCFDCHNGNYTSTPNTCNGCHAADFNNTTNPNHSAAGFPTDCISCHSQTAWAPASFDHDGQYFPIYSGKHREKWNLCSECHTVANNFAVFSCIDCHEHNKTETDDQHSDVANYVYLSTACFDCHPTGQEVKLKGLVR